MPITSVIRLDLLKPHPANVRKTNRTKGIEALAENIPANGLIQGFSVVENGGDYLVIAGARRLAALQLLVTKKKLQPTFDVPCHVYDRTDPNLAEISLSENEMRQAMHPADQFDAFKKLVDEGKGRDTIAALYGVTPHVVEQRLKLANVSPKLVKIYREGGMSLEQVMAFSLTTDQKRQENVWNDQPNRAKEQQRDDTVRRAITDKHIPSDNDLATFVGVEDYEAAGGQVLRDLFADGEGAEAYFANAALLDKLAGEKLEKIAENFVRAKGLDQCIECKKLWDAGIWKTHRRDEGEWEVGMTVLSSSTIPLIDDRLRMLGAVTLSAEVATELLSRAASSYSMELVLSQIATGNGREAAWAKRTLSDLERTRPKLKYPDRLVKIEVQ